MTLNFTKTSSILAFCSVFTLLQACVPAKQLELSKQREKTCQEENTRLKDDNMKMSADLKDLQSEVEELKKNVNELSRDTTSQGVAYRRLTGLYEDLTESYDKLLANNERLLAGNTEETRKLISQLNIVQEDLQRKEDRLRKDSLTMAEREHNLDSLKSSLKERDDRVRQLESILGRSDSTVSALRKAVSDALLGFENKGLTIQQKGSRVYVSMDEQLLFASGSTVIEKKGEQALHQLAEVLASNEDINVTVEGHTDNVPISGVLPSGARDNWDLSVLRATSVTKILLNGSTIDPNRITASGRASYSPIDPANTKEARQKNRRTEVILTPKLDDLLRLLDQFNQEAK
jgi:chemotaxis protein MotB